MLHNTYHGDNIETYLYVICSIPEDVSKLFTVTKLTYTGTGTFREVMDNDKKRGIMYLHQFGVKPVNLEV